MFLFRKSAEMPTRETALKGRETPIPTAERHFVNGRPLQGPYPAGMEKAVFGLGCFWGAERKFWEAPGVWTTAVGYAGGSTANPTYEEVCSGRTGHTEAVRVVFDPTKTSYEALLRLFWETHDPTQGMRQGNDVGTQYRSAILWPSEAQRDAAIASQEAFAKSLKAAAGMTFSDEPGIYIRGEFGVRLEDDMVITTDGARLLTPQSESLEKPF